MIVVLSVAYQQRLLEQAREELYVAQLEAALFNVEQDYTKNLLHILENINPASNKMTRQELVDRSSKLAEMKRALEALMVKFRANAERTDYLVHKATGYFWWGIFQIVVGVTMSGFGFFRWYFIIQKPSDDQLRAAINSAEQG
jgi:hypothetical protein